MKMYNVECNGCTFSMYMFDSYHKMYEAQIDVLAKYISDFENPFVVERTAKIIKALFDFGVITQEALDKIVPFSKIKLKESRGKMAVHG